MTGRIRSFIDDFGKLPEEPPASRIPDRWRIPIFLSMIVVGILALVLFVWLVVAPALSSQNGAARSKPMSHFPAGPSQ